MELVIDAFETDADRSAKTPVTPQQSFPKKHIRRLGLIPLIRNIGYRAIDVLYNS